MAKFMCGVNVVGHVPLGDVEAETWQEAVQKARALIPEEMPPMAGDQFEYGEVEARLVMSPTLDEMVKPKEGA